jgi:hypothetical protein
MTANMSSEELRRLQALGYVGGGVQTTADEETEDSESDSDDSEKADADDH